MNWALGVSLAVLSQGVWTQPSIVAISDLPGGLPVSSAYGVSSDGATITGMSYTSSGQTLIQWTKQGGLEQLPSAGQGDQYGYAFSPSGNYIAGRFNNHGLIWSDDLGSQSIGSLPGGRDESFVFDVNDEGLVVGYASASLTNIGASRVRAVTWTPQNGLTALPYPVPSDADSNYQASGILDDGRVLVNANSGAWLYSEQTGYEQLPVGNYMTSINRAGDFMVGTEVTGVSWDRGTYWTPGTGEVHLIPMDPNDHSTVIDASADGSIIIGRGLDQNEYFIWEDQGVPVPFEEYVAGYGLDLSDWFIEHVNAVSADGNTFVGTGAMYDWETGRSEGFVITIPSSCPSDVNGDGQVTASDFTAWIKAYHNGLPACDQNVDGECSPTDFTAWITNYNAGC